MATESASISFFSIPCAQLAQVGASQERASGYTKLHQCKTAPLPAKTKANQKVYEGLKPFPQYHLKLILLF